jgi:hypothetical protein
VSLFQDSRNPHIYWCFEVLNKMTLSKYDNGSFEMKRAIVFLLIPSLYSAVLAANKATIRVYL